MTQAAREYHTQQIHYLRKSITFADDDVINTVGVIPSGSLILKPISGVAITVAFDGTTTNTLDIGTTADPNLYGTVLALGTIGFVALDEAVSNVVAADTLINASVLCTGALTAGTAEVVIAYIPDNDG